MAGDHPDQDGFVIHYQRPEGYWSWLLPVLSAGSGALLGDVN
jgi:hypothetical protein